MTYQQPPPQLGNQYDGDRVLRSFLRRALPAEVLTSIEDALREMGRLSGGPLYRLQRADRLNEPVLTPWDAWGNRIDHIELTPLWKEAGRLAAEHGVVAAAYDEAHGRHARLHQFALAYLFIPSTDMYGCPLAMTDGAARTLLASGEQDLIDRAVPRLTNRDPERFWTSGQWMTELPGGSDVSRTETVARQDDDGTWRLYGRKWFTSAVTSPMALALTRPEGNAEGSKGLALFYVELRDEEGRLQRITVNRLKDKLGTRKLPTAELQLEGAPAVPVGGLSHGVRQIAPMLNVTRTWNAVTACAYMRRGLALARDYAHRRHAFGAALADKPLHIDTLAGLQAEFEAAFHLTFRAVELLGRHETGDDEHDVLLRILTPVAKLTTARQAVAVTSEVLEAFGGAGYVEDTGLPMLLRDAQVLSIWEGTTNVLALETLRAVHHAGGLDPVLDELRRCAGGVEDERLVESLAVADDAVKHAGRWLAEATQQGRAEVERGARRFALTLGRALALARLVLHAQWSLDHQDDALAWVAARRFAAKGIDLIVDAEGDDAHALANDTPLAVRERARASV